MNSNSNNANGNNEGTQLEIAPSDGLPNLIFPELALAPDDYARLELRLDFYSDLIVAKEYENGQETKPPYVVDPLQIGAALGGINLNSGLMPPDCLFWGMIDGYPRLGVFVPGKTWSVPVRDGGEDKTLNIPLPPFVFIGHRYDYSVWATTERPTSLNTQLYVAPCPNIGLTTGVCRGNVTFPHAGNGTIWQAVEVFFSASRFNQDLGQHKSKGYPNDILEQWYALDRSAATNYPLEDLLPVKNLTLGRLINNELTSVE